MNVLFSSNRKQKRSIYALPKPVYMTSKEGMSRLQHVCLLEPLLVSVGHLQTMSLLFGEVYNFNQILYHPK